MPFKHYFPIVLSFDDTLFQIGDQFEIQLYHVLYTIKMLWYVHTALVAYEHKSEARNLRHHITLFLIFFFVSSEGGGAINELILGFKNSFIGNNYKFASALSIWVLCHEVLFTTEKLKKKFCAYFEKGWTKYVLEIPNQFRLGLGLCYECIYYDVYLRRRKFKNFHHEDYHYKYMILSNPIEFVGHFVSVITLVMISMSIRLVSYYFISVILISIIVVSLLHIWQISLSKVKSLPSPQLFHNLVQTLGFISNYVLLPQQFSLFHKISS